MDVNELRASARTVISVRETRELLGGAAGLRQIYSECARYRSTGQGIENVLIGARVHVLVEPLLRLLGVTERASDPAPP